MLFFYLVGLKRPAAFLCKTIKIVSIYLSIYIYGSSSLAPVCRNEQGSDRRITGSLPETDGGREATHLRGDGECSLRLPTSGAALHVADHHQNLKHP